MSAKRRGPAHTVHDRRFGDIPLVPVERRLPSGEMWRGAQHDPDYQPPMPAGAVRGDVRKQRYCPMCHVPRYFFVDEEKCCVQCGERFLFGRAEQKFWYETLKFHFDSTAIRCPECRRRQRTEKALREQLARTRAGLAERIDDPALLLELAETIVRLHERTDHGRLDDAVAAARRARRLWPEAVEALFWEAAAHAGAGRRNRALPLFEEFLKAAGSRRSLRAKVERARTYRES
jgi:hypothetical protein